MDRPPPTILIVDDNPSNLALLVDHLSDLGCRVLVAGDGETGLERAKYTNPDLILMDVLMPGMDGFEACRRLKKMEKVRDIPVIFMTALGQREHILEGFDAGGVDYLVKPFNIPEVWARVRTHLDLRRTQVQLKSQNTKLELEIETRKQMEEQLRQHRELLEDRVKERTAELRRINQALNKEIAEKVRAEKALRASEERLRLILDTISTGIYIVDPGDFRITYSNPEAARLIGLPREELIGKYCHEIVGHHGDRRRCPIIDLGQTMDSSKRFLKSADGRLIPVFKTVVRTMLEGRECLLESFIDLTALEEMEKQKFQIEAQLFQAQKMEALGALASGIAHDFNNILGAITGYTELSLLGMPESEQTYLNLQQVLKATGRARDLVKQILTFSRQAGRRLAPLEIGPIVKEALKFMRSTLPTTIEIRQDIRDMAPAVLADPIQVHQVVMNLCTNAAQAMKEKGGCLTVELSPIDFEAALADLGLGPGRHLRLTVSDTGLGMDQETLKRIFEPYFTTKEQGEGTGMGLAVVHGIVKSHHGAITVDSEPGQGATFHIYLPAIEERAGTEEEGRLPPPTGTERILFVDDEP
ncbi:MAG: response regulator, partial [Thermodesulfobacteriota bacterium]